MTQNVVDMNRLRRELAQSIREHRWTYWIEGILIMIVGVAAIALPYFSTLAVEIFVGWALLIGGIVRLVSLFRARGTPAYWWSVAAAVVATLLGVALILRPIAGIVSLTLALSIVFLVEGIAAIVGAFYVRPVRTWGWTLLSGIVDLALVFLIWAGWPTTALWVLGVFTGVNLVFLGLSLAMLASAAPPPPVAPQSH